MRLETITIDHFRSIEHIELQMPDKKPLVLFGPNNAGKSNILAGINRLLGERYPSYIEMLDSDYFCRNHNTYPNAEITATFDGPIYYDRYKGNVSRIAVRYGKAGDPNNNLIHDGNGNKIFISNEDRAKCQSFLIDAERNIQSAFNYSSQYSLLSRFTKKIHAALSSEHKEDLTTAFETIKDSFEETEEFSSFFDTFSKALSDSVKGFVHSLAVDFSAYDPNNYAKSLRIYAKEGDDVRGFEEFGTGEQQVLLMAFVKAYMETFTAENFILIIEEPEAHLHPLAQRWLKEFITDICSSGIQVILSTHSTDLIDISYLDGLVRVYKDDGITRAIQLSRDGLCEHCISLGVPEGKVSTDNIIDFYSTKLFSDQLKGFFAETIILVEGATEFFALPEYLKKVGFSLAEHGVEIVNCRGKDTVPLLWRLFKSYKYNVFSIFDGDKNKNENTRIFKGLIDDNEWKDDETQFYINDGYAYFGKDFETYFRSSVENYHDLELLAINDYGITSKPGKAKAVAQLIEETPSFVLELVSRLEKLESKQTE